MDIRTGIKYPIQGEDGGELLGVLIAFGFIIAALLQVNVVLSAVIGLPLCIFWTGSVMRVLNESANGQTQPPKFTEIGRLFSDGLRGISVVLCYAAIPGAFAILGTIGLVRLAQAEVSRGNPLALTISTLIIFTIGIIAYILPAGLTRTATDQSITSAFSKEVTSIIRSTRYFTDWTGCLIAAMSITSLAGFLLTVSYILGGTIGIPLVVYVMLSCSHVIGRTVGKVRA